MSEFYLKTLIYTLSLILSFYSLQAIDYNRLIKKNHVSQAQLLYFLCVVALAYLVGSFFIAFFYWR